MFKGLQRILATLLDENPPTCIDDVLFPARYEYSRIPPEPEANPITPYIALMKTEGVVLVFESDAIAALADIAVQVNYSVANIGARRLHTLIERVLDDISFTASDRNGEAFRITGDYVREKLGRMAGDKDLSKYIL